MTMSGRSATGTFQSFDQSVEYRVGLPGQNATEDALGELLRWARADFDGGSERHRRRAGRQGPHLPAVAYVAHLAGETLDVIRERGGRVDVDDSLHHCVAPDLNPACGADRSFAVAGLQHAGVVDVVDPRADGAEVRQGVPDRLWLRRYGPGPGDGSHHSIEPYGRRPLKGLSQYTASLAPIERH